MRGNLELLVPILIPLIVGIVFFFMKKGVKSIFLITIFTATIFALYNCFSGEKELLLWKLTESMPILLRLDNLGRFFSALTSIIWCVVAVYTVKYVEHEERVNSYLGFYLMTYSVLLALDYSATLVTMYLFYELMTVISIGLVVHTRTKEAISASLRYLLYSLFGAFMGLMCIFFIDANSATLEFTAGGVLSVDMPNKELMLIIAFIGILGFGTKAGMFPLHGWLPVAHPVAPAPASAALSGIITKSGVLAIMRLVFYIFGDDFIRGTWVQYTWIILALATVVMGSMMAFKETNLKKRLAYSSVSQLSYILVGLAMLTTSSIEGALLHVSFHAILKVCLFLCAGSIIFKTGIKQTDELQGIGKRLPLTMTAFTVASLGLVGIPPLSGFISKWFLASGALQADISVLSWLAPVVLLVSAILTAGYLFPICIQGFLVKDTVIKREKESALMYIPLIVLSVASIVFGIVPNVLIEFFAEISTSLV